MIELQKEVCEYILKMMQIKNINTNSIQEKGNNPFSISCGYINGLLSAYRGDRVFQMSRTAWKKILDEAGINYVECLDADIFMLRKIRKDIKKEIRGTYFNQQEFSDIAFKLGVKPAELKRYLISNGLEKLKKIM